MEAQLFTVVEAARYLRCSRGFVYRLIAAGELESRTLGRRRLIAGSALDALWSKLDRGCYEVRSGTS